MNIDLSKNSTTQDDWIINGDNVLEEVFDTIAKTTRGDIFYARDLGTNLESLLFELNERNLLIDTMNCLREFNRLDGRLSFNPSSTSVSRDPYNPQELNIQVTTRGSVALNTKIGEVSE